jgi:hypothetical protein
LVAFHRPRHHVWYWYRPLDRDVIGEALERTRGRVLIMRWKVVFRSVSVLHWVILLFGDVASRKTGKYRHDVIDMGRLFKVDRSIPQSARQMLFTRG